MIIICFCLLDSGHKRHLDDTVSISVPDSVPFVKFAGTKNLLSYNSKNASTVLVDIEGPVDAAFLIIEKECPKLGDILYRVPPLIVSRLARGGKTTFLMSLFNRLQLSEKYLPIIISFNTSSNFEPVFGQNDEETLIRVIAAQFVEIGPHDDASKIVCTKEALLDYIETATAAGGYEGVVLLIDELNALRRPLDSKGAKFLREHFLDSEKRYLVYTTHVLMDVEGVCVADSLGKNSHSGTSSSAAVVMTNNKKSSNRSYKTVHMPQSFDLELLRTMPSCGAVSATLVSLCSGIPSLIFCEMSLHEESLQNRFDRIGIYVHADEQREVLLDFVGEVLSGRRGGPEAKCRRFDIVSSVLDIERVQWPMCYIGCICNLFTAYGLSLRISHQINALYTHAQNIESGKDWEIVITIATIFRCLLSQLLGAQGPFEIAPAQSFPHVVYMETPSKTLPEVFSEIGSRYDGYLAPTILIVTLTYSKFADFDLLVCYGRQQGGFRCDGYQMKLGRAYPKRPVPTTYVQRGFLFRGRAPASESRKDSWQYLSEGDVKEFLGYSFSPLIPSQCGNVPETDLFE